MKKIRLSLVALSILMFFGCGGEKMETVHIEKRSIEQLLVEYEEWQAGKGANNTKTFTAKAISAYYGIEDLKKDNQYIEYHDIYDFVSSSSAWHNLGDAKDKLVMDNAQEFANKGVPVIATDTDDKHKLTVLIIAGEQASSSKWGVKVPNAAAFFPKNGPEPFVNKTLNYAWSSPDDIEIWVRK
ncbi:MAG: hypothetical protein JKX68_03285 [Flavobacteriales bacterium]|nr:hypothetical protein [Flavobacteriales bacterium]